MLTVNPSADASESEALLALCRHEFRNQLPEDQEAYTSGLCCCTNPSIDAIDDTNR